MSDGETALATGGTAPYKRVYVDLPTDVHKRLQVRARESRQSMKDYLSRLINKDCGSTPAPRSKVSV